jgi:hypothetical protein
MLPPATLADCECGQVKHLVEERRDDFAAAWACEYSFPALSVGAGFGAVSGEMSQKCVGYVRITRANHAAARAADG